MLPLRKTEDLRREPPLMIVLPTQFPGRRHTHDLAVRRLMTAVLEDAIHCYRKYWNARDGHGRRMFRDAERWLLLDDRDAPFSFETVCEALDVSPQWVRRQLAHWRAERMARLGQPYRTYKRAKYSRTMRSDEKPSTAIATLACIMPTQR